MPTYTRTTHARTTHTQTYSQLFNYKNGVGNENNFVGSLPISVQSDSLFPCSCWNTDGTVANLQRIR